MSSRVRARSDGAPWVADIGVHVLSGSSLNDTVAADLTLIVVPEEFDRLRSLVLELERDGCATTRLGDISLINVDNSVCVSRVWSEDILTVELKLDGCIVLASSHPWVSAVSSHDFSGSWSDCSIADLLSLEVEPEELDSLVCLIVKGHWEASVRVEGCLLEVDCFSCLHHATVGNKSCDSSCEFHHFVVCCWFVGFVFTYKFDQRFRFYTDLVVLSSIN